MRSIRNHVLCALAGLLLARSVQAARLTDGVANPGGPFSFRIQCESNEVHLVQRSTNLVNWTTWMRSVSGGTNRYVQGHQMFSSVPQSFFRTIQTNEPVFAYGLAAKTIFDLNGNNLYADSFDSSIPGRNVNGQWNLSIRRDQANIAFGTAASNVSNLTIFGICYVEGAQLIPIGPQSSVGTILWHLAGNRGIQPGFQQTNWTVPHREVALRLVPNPGFRFRLPV